MHCQYPVPLQREPAWSSPDDPQAVQVTPVLTGVLRFEVRCGFADLQHLHVRRQVGVQCQPELLRGQLQAGVQMRGQGQGMDAAVRASGSVYL